MLRPSDLHQLFHLFHNLSALQVRNQFHHDHKNLFEILYHYLEPQFRPLLSQDDWLKDNPPQIDWFGLRFESAETASDSALISEFTKSFERLTDKQPIVLGGGGSDLRLPILHADSPSALFGPTGGAIHSTDEYVEIDSVMEVARILGGFILDWCEVAD
jgi:acetylornithine deacetylase